MENYFRKLTGGKLVGFAILSIVLSLAPIIIFTVKSGFDITNSYGIAKITLIASIIMYAVMLIPFFYFITKEERERIIKKAPSRKKGNILYVIIPVFAFWGINIIISFIISLIFPGFMKLIESSGNTSSNISVNGDIKTFIFLFISMVVLAPIIEELFFRGLLYNELNKRRSLLFSMIISSLFFGILHGFTFIQTSIMGIIFALIYQVTGNIKISIASHALNNFLALIFATFNVDKIESLYFLVPFYIISFVSLIYLIYYFAKLKPRTIFNDVSPIYKKDVKEGKIKVIKDRKYIFDRIYRG